VRLPFPPLRRAAQKRAGAKGFGLFAGQDLKAGQFVIEYLGEVLEEEEYHRRYRCGTA
jgi:SET domain-containing protein